jgi:class 3 adenylate cyclase
LASPPLGGRPLLLKAGAHYGPSIAVTLNERLDYFGSTVNIASRLETLSNGGDIVITAAIYDDPEVSAWLAESEKPVSAQAFTAHLRGFGSQQFTLWRVRMPTGRALASAQPGAIEPT